MLFLSKYSLFLHIIAQKLPLENFNACSPANHQTPTSTLLDLIEQQFSNPSNTVLLPFLEEMYHALDSRKATKQYMVDRMLFMGNNGQLFSFPASPPHITLPTYPHKDSLIAAISSTIAIYRPMVAQGVFLAVEAFAALITSRLVLQRGFYEEALALFVIIFESNISSDSSTGSVAQSNTLTKI